MKKKVILDRAAFFAALRKDNSGVFSRRLSKAQVQGIEALLDSADRHAVYDMDHVAHILAEVYHETGTYMLGIKETVMPSHTDKRPSDATVKARLEKAWKAGNLPWVTTPYWRDGGFGRGPIQLTHWSNYEKVGAALGLNLRQDPDLALDPKVGADIVVVGLSKGLFTGKKLSDYEFPRDLKAISKWHPRRMVNGVDGTDDEIARYHGSFYQALMAGGYKVVDDLIAATSITASKITADKLRFDDLAVGTVTSGVLKSADGRMSVDLGANQILIDAVTPKSKWGSLIKLVLKLLGVRYV
ncbi:hypothetical protein IB276_32855 [Ensifer sp. ENS04]|uniref:glycoside hydrolase family 19 protein n=1 Tax=Ensifer sp. ENS04 TaxID=2769281 RepID=UPI001786D6C9|nr:glycoside hydrolase family 19 protein [Ensifer sp. ENS04]MBD9544236.1 hypothetical protein [Ensifer sp. ENS04]